MIKSEQVKTGPVRFQFKDGQYPLSMEAVYNLINGGKTFRDKLIIETLYMCGFRRFEVAKMKVEHIDFNLKRVRVIGKGGKIADIPVGAVFPEYLVDLKHFIGNHKEGYVFLSNRNKPLTLARINQILDETAIQAKITNPNPKKKHLNPHALRHSVARHLKDLGFTAEFIKNYLRHESIITTMDIYGTLSIDEMEKQARQKLSNTKNLLIHNDQ